MKKTLFIFSLSAFLIMTTGCLSTNTSSSSAKKTEQPPKRVFESVDTIGLSLSDMFIVENGFTGNGKSYSKPTVEIAAALLAFDIGIQNDISKEDYAKLGQLFFSNLPQENEVKEIVIPQLGTNEDAGAEKNGYFFIFPKTDNNGKVYYSIESNLPIGSIWAKTYDGYFISRSGKFYENKVPASWCAIMSIYIQDEKIVYNGVAYPNKTAPLKFSGTGIGPDTYLKNLKNADKPLDEIMSELEKVVYDGIEKTPTDDENAKASMLLLEKYANESLSFYAYANNDIKKAKDYLTKSKSIDFEPPENMIGGQCKNLEVFMDWIFSK